MREKTVNQVGRAANCDHQSENEKSEGKCLNRFSYHGEFQLIVKVASSSFNFNACHKILMTSLKTTTAKPKRNVKISREEQQRCVSDIFSRLSKLFTETPSRTVKQPPNMKRKEN